jgi:hypothetical protein
MNWLNAIRTELDIPTGVVHRFYTRAFEGHSWRLSSEAAFLTEVANALGGERGELLNAQLKEPAAADEIASIAARLDYLRRFNRFIAYLRRYLRRRALKRRLLKLFGRGDETKDKRAGI